MKKNETPSYLIYMEFGMEVLGVIDTKEMTATLRVKLPECDDQYFQRVTLYKVNFDEFYDLEKIKAKLTQKAEAYLEFVDA